jgi:hypothetical protein
MASFRLMHRATGVVLSGYVVLSATPQEIETANRNLSASGSCFRYIDSSATTHPAVDNSNAQAA